MQVGSADLTYCTNIHAADGWAAVLDNLRRHSVELKRRLSPDSSFGIGLRLSNEEAQELLEDDQLNVLAGFLKQQGLYVNLINGFPYGWFHERRLKDLVFAPDWQTQERVDYTLRLIEILARLLPEGADGGISTSPLSYKPWVSRHGEPNSAAITDKLLQVVAKLMVVHREQGRLIHLDIEPEPDGTVENTSEFIEFFKELVRVGTPILARKMGCSQAQAEESIRAHVCLCYDLCHFSVEGEHPEKTLAQLTEAGVQIGRVQVSSALRVAVPESRPAREGLEKRLAAFVDPVYLHQVIGDRRRFSDLEQGLGELASGDCKEWRIHFHVPLFLERFGEFESTQNEVKTALEHLRRSSPKHYEIETYTWSVLPADLKLDLVESIEREYRWVMAHL